MRMIIAQVGDEQPLVVVDGTELCRMAHVSFVQISRQFTSDSDRVLYDAVR